MDPEIPVDKVSGDDVTAALLSVTMLASITPFMTEFNISETTKGKVIAEAIVGMMILGEEKLKLPLVEELRKALDKPGQNWTRFYDRQR
jgi:hypothetical protein